MKSRLNKKKKHKMKTVTVSGGAKSGKSKLIEKIKSVLSEEELKNINFVEKNES